MERGIEIVGGGLAGLSLGLALRRAGVAVALFESGGYPRHRVCGEFIAGLSGATIRSLGLEPFLSDALRHREVAWHWGGEEAVFQTLPAPALGISRHRLDHRLADAFVRAGGRLHPDSRVADLADRPGRVIAVGRARGGSEWVGLKGHALGMELVRDLELHLGDGAYVGLSRVEDGRVNVCGLFRQGSAAAAAAGAGRFSALRRHVEGAGMDALAERLRQADFDSDSFCAVAALRFDRRVGALAGVRLGDAAAMIPPFTGNGMAMAFQSAEIALPHLAAYARGDCSWSAAKTAIRRHLARHFRVRLASADALHPWLLKKSRRGLLSAAARRHLLPFRPLYALLH